jgi:hypothetical protein
MALAPMTKFGLLKNNYRLSHNWQGALVVLIDSTFTGMATPSIICG